MIIAKEIFSVNDWESNEDVFEWIMDSVEGIEISDDEEEVIREESIDSIVSFFNNRLSGYYIDTNETEESIEVIITKTK